MAIHCDIGGIVVTDDGPQPQLFKGRDAFQRAVQLLSFLYVAKRWGGGRGDLNSIAFPTVEGT